MKDLPLKTILRAKAIMDATPMLGTAEVPTHDCYIFYDGHFFRLKAGVVTEIYDDEEPHA